MMFENNMYVVIYTVILSPLIFLFHAILCNIFNNPSLSIKLMFASFLFYFISIILFFILFLKIVISPPIAISIISTYLSLCLIYIEIFSMICRGFSIRIITDIYKNGGLELDNIIKGYSDGRGIGWLIKKRIDSLIKLKFLVKEDGFLKINNQFIVGLISLSNFYKLLIKIGKGGE